MSVIGHASNLELPAQAVSGGSAARTNLGVLAGISVRVLIATGPYIGKRQKEKALNSQGGRHLGDVRAKAPGLPFVKLSKPSLSIWAFLTGSKKQDGKA